jgi:hypothetical protein
MEMGLKLKDTFMSIEKPMFKSNVILIALAHLGEAIPIGNQSIPTREFANLSFTKKMKGMNIVIYYCSLVINMAKIMMSDPKKIADDMKLPNTSINKIVRADIFKSRLGIDTKDVACLNMAMHPVDGFDQVVGLFSTAKGLKVINHVSQGNYVVKGYEDENGDPIKFKLSQVMELFKTDINFIKAIRNAILYEKLDHILPIKVDRETESAIADLF